MIQNSCHTPLSLITSTCNTFSVVVEKTSHLNIILNKEMTNHSMNALTKTETMMLPEIIQLCDDNLELANVKSRNDFIEETKKLYVNYHNMEHNTSFLNETLESVIRSSIPLTEDHHAKLLFKLTVEMSTEKWSTGVRT